MTEQQQPQTEAEASIPQEQIDAFIVDYVVQFQDVFMRFVMATNSRANELKLPFPVLMFYMADAICSSVYELIKSSSGAEHDQDHPVALTEDEQEIMKMIKQQFIEGWDLKFGMLADQERLSAATVLDGDAHAAQLANNSEPKH